MSKDAFLSLDATSLDAATLPDDPALLKRFFVDYQRQVAAERCEREALIARIKEEAARQVESLEQRKAAMEAEHQAAIQALFRRYYGPRSEKFDPRQLLLFGQIVEQMPLDEASIEAEAGEQLVTRRVVIRRVNSSHSSAGSFRPGVWVNDRCGRYDWQVSAALASTVLDFFFVLEPVGAMAGFGSSVTGSAGVVWLRSR